MQIVTLADKARELAKKLHTEIDRDGKPHFAHVERVAKLVAAAHGYEDGMIVFGGMRCGKNFLQNSIAVAYLHDTLEDTEITYADVLRDFGEDIAASFGISLRPSM